MATSVIQPSFAAGELSPNLYGRVDLAIYKIGAARLLNFFVDYRGGASTRAGTKFVGQCKDSSRVVRLLRFQFSTFNTYALEFGHLYMRVILNGAYVLETPKTITSITQALVGVVTAPAHGFVSGDSVYIAGVVGMTVLNGKTFNVTVIDANTFTLATLSGTPVNTLTYSAYISGGTVARIYTLVTPYAASDLALLKYTQSADVLTLCHPLYQTRDLTRLANDNWQLTLVDMAASISPPPNISLATTAAGTVTFAYVVTAVRDNGEESIASPAASIASVNIATTSGSITVTWPRVAGAAYYRVYKAQVQPSVSAIPGVAFGFVGNAYGLQFVDGNIVPDFSSQPPKNNNPFAPRAIRGYTIVNGGAGYSATATATVTDPTGTGAVLLPIVIGGAVVGFIVENGGKNYTAPSIALSGGGAGLVVTWDIGPADGVWPSVTTYFQQRKNYAASLLAPSTVWGSKPGAFNNFDSSNPVNDGDSYEITIAAQEVNAVKSMVPMPGGLVVFTSAGVWQLSGGGNNEALTPINAVATPQAYNGASDVPPITINYDILYVQNKGSVVRNLQYNLLANIYTSTDITVRSNHMFFGHIVTEWAYAEDPFKIVWAVRDDGVLLAMTYLREQELIGWSRHITDGLFESVITVQEQNTDAVYVVVRRYIGGAWVRYVERFAARIFPGGVEDAWAVDCGLALTPNYPQAVLSLTQQSNTVYQFTTDVNVFVPGDVNRILRAAGGKFQVTQVTNGQSILGRVMRPPVSSTVIAPIPGGEWTLDTPVTQISGLEHLEGETVAILGDGNVFAQQTVSNGQITLPEAVTRLTVGLPFIAQLETLNLDVGEPTIQGKRKKISAVTVRMEQSRGLAVGPTFNELTDIKERRRQPLGEPIELISGDERIIITPNFSTLGRICIEQQNPLPATVLAVIPEVTVGDTDNR